MSETDFVKLTFFPNTIEAEQAVLFLKENGIEAYHQGGIMEVYGGNSMDTAYVMVSAKDKKKAQRLLDAFTPIETTGKATRQTGARWQKVLCWAMLIFLLVILLGSTIGALFF